MVQILFPRAIREVNDKIPVRLNIAIMLFMGCLITYMLRVNLSINLLAMVKDRNSTQITANSTNHTEVIKTTGLPDYGPRYDWSASQQSLLLGAYFWGYLVTSLPAGMLAEKFGGRKVVGWTLVISAILTGISPPVAAWGFYPFYILRVLLGVFGGVLYPAFHQLISKWAPPNEKGKFVSALMGNAFGTVLTWPLSGIIIETIGWDFAFYIPAAITAVVAGFWFYLVADKPRDHPRISAEEKSLIEKSLVGVGESKKTWPPVLSLAISLPFWALLILHYGNLWGLYFLVTAAPKYMSEILKFNLAKAGLLSALPYLARMIFGFFFGSIGDVVRKNEWMTTTMIRKFFCIFSHIIPGLFLIGLGYIGQNPYICVAIITLSLGFNGSSTVTNLQNSQDLAPNYAGTLYGIINFVGTTSGFISPLVVGYFTKDHNTDEEWSKIFLVGAVAYIVPAIVFAFFGTGDVQKWNERDENKKDDDAATVAAS